MILKLFLAIQGPDGTPYEKGVFKLEIGIPERYPLEPPKVRFLTQIYHPNIDEGGRICLNILVMPPKGGWTPSLNISTVLTSIQSLLAEPNPDDGLVQYIVTFNLLLFIKILLTYLKIKRVNNINITEMHSLKKRENLHNDLLERKMTHFIFNHL